VINIAILLVPIYDYATLQIKFPKRYFVPTCCDLDITTKAVPNIQFVFASGRIVSQIIIRYSAE